MDINFNPNQGVQQQQPQQQTLNPNAQAGATQTLQSSPDNVVTATTETSQSNTRDEDASRRESRGDRQSSLRTMDELRISGLKTRVGYDNEQETVFLEVLQPRTDDVIIRIPSEELIQYLSQQAQQLRSGGEVNAASSTAALDQSI